MARNGWPSWRVTAALIGVGVVLAGLLASTTWAQTPAATPTAPHAPAASAASGSGDMFQSPVVGPVLGAAIALFGVLCSQMFQGWYLRRTLRHQSEQEALKDAHNLRDRRFEREAAACENLWGAATAMVATARQVQVLSSRANQATEVDRLETAAWNAMMAARQMSLRLSPDEEARSIRSLFESIWETYSAHSRVTRMVNGPPYKEDPLYWLDRTKLLKEQATALQHLDQLLPKLEEKSLMRLERLRTLLNDPPPSEEPPHRP